MLRWNRLRHRASVFRRQPCLALSPWQTATHVTIRAAGVRWATSTSVDEAVAQRRGKPVARSDLADGPPRRSLEDWLALLESTLPPRLREKSQLEEGTRLSPLEVFEVLTTAGNISGDVFGKDILSYLALEKGRWAAVVWLVKHLVKSFAVTDSDADESASMICEWKNDARLEDLTEAPIDLLRPDFLQRSTTDDNGSLSLEAASRIDDHRGTGYDVLAMIWRGLGSMTISCGDGEVRPEILEMIAILHHQGFMPSSIYDSKPSSDPTAIQQSPILNLLSSRILTSLSDAAWRAFEKLVLEEAKTDTAGHASHRPELAASSYRVRVAGVRSEVWLELILWSCLHGGWITEGMRILRKLVRLRGENEWRPLSWRSIIPEQPSSTKDWDKVEYLFNNWTSASMDMPIPSTPIFVRRTISSEVVNAYVDASISVLHMTRTDKRKGALPQVLEFLTNMQQFLSRSSLNLGAGSWDAIILRLFDLGDETFLSRPKSFDRVMELSPGMGREIASADSQGPPDYVFDGTAATFGFFHGALSHCIRRADVEGALRLFATLQQRADENKRQSVADFLQKRNLSVGSDEDANTGQFTANFARIDYPAFYVQIPPNILGPFIELVTDAKAYEFGKWLLYSEEIDGPIVPRRLYGDASICPALIRFAAECEDKALLKTLIEIRAKLGKEGEPRLPFQVLRSFLDSQVNLMRWHTATKILNHMKDVYGVGWNITSLCHLLRVSLLQVRRAEAGNQTAQDNLDMAKVLFQDVVQGSYGRPGVDKNYLQEQVDNLLVVLARLNTDWAAFSTKTQAVTGYRVFNISSKSFNLVLQGAVDAYGSHAGRRLIGVFWNHEVRNAQRRESEANRGATAPPYSSFGRAVPPHLRQQRTVVRYLGQRETNVSIYGGLRPDLRTIRIVLNKAMEELINEASDDASANQELEAVQELVNESSDETSADQEPVATTMTGDPDTDAEVDALDEPDKPAIDSTPVGMVVWGARCLRQLGMTVDDLAERLRQDLPEAKLQKVLEKAPDLLDPMSTDQEYESEENSDEDAVPWTASEDTAASYRPFA